MLCYDLCDPYGICVKWFEFGMCCLSLACDYVAVFGYSGCLVSVVVVVFKQVWIRKCVGCMLRCGSSFCV